MPAYYTYRGDVPVAPGGSVGFTPGRGYYAIPPVKAAPPRPPGKPTPPPTPGIKAPPKTVSYDPNAYVPGGSSTKVAVAIETQGLKASGPGTVQVPIAVVTNLAQDTGKPVAYHPTPPPAPSTPGGSTPYPEHGVLDRDQLESVWTANGGNPDLAALAAGIALCESSGNTDSIDNTAYPSRPGYHKPGVNASPEYSVGLWQVNAVAHPSYSVSDLQTADGNAKAIIAITGNGARFAQTNVYCYAVATNALGVPNAPSIPPLTSGPVEPASVHGAWGNLLNVLGVKVAEGLASITSNANALSEVFK